MKIEIVFRKSSSKNYLIAVTNAKEFNKYIPVGEIDEYNHSIIDSRDVCEKYAEIQELWQVVSGWKASAILVDGKPVKYMQAEEIFKIIKCCKYRQDAIVPEEYCNPKSAGWGCIFLRGIGYGKNEDGKYTVRSESYREWYEFGSFKGKNEWVINKNEILSALKREAKAKSLELCDVFSFEAVQAVINSLPDSIDLEKTTNWVPKTSDVSNDDSCSQIVVGIEPREIVDPTSWSFSLNDMLSSSRKNKAEERKRNIPEIAFKDIGGLEGILRTIREVVELPLIRKDLLDYFGVVPHRGILLHGEPGCGKTLIAKAIANEVRAHFIGISGPELLSKYVGQSEENLREVFLEAREYQPSIVFFDEIDSIAQSRSGDEINRHSAQFVGQLLTLMDGINEFGNVSVIASTNRPELLDRALLRPGRFDLSIEVQKPTLSGCKRIFEIHTEKMPLDSDFDSSVFAEKLLGCTGAEIAFVAREAAYNAMRRVIDIERIVLEQQSQVFYQGSTILRQDFERALQTLYQANDHNLLLER